MSGSIPGSMKNSRPRPSANISSPCATAAKPSADYSYRDARYRGSRSTCARDSPPSFASALDGFESWRWTGRSNCDAAAKMSAMPSVPVQQNSLSRRRLVTDHRPGILIHRGETNVGKTGADKEVFGFCALGVRGDARDHVVEHYRAQMLEGKASDQPVIC